VGVRVGEFVGVRVGVTNFFLGQSLIFFWSIDKIFLGQSIVGVRVGVAYSCNKLALIF